VVPALPQGLKPAIITFTITIIMVLGDCWIYTLEACSYYDGWPFTGAARHQWHCAWHLSASFMQPVIVRQFAAISGCTLFDKRPSRTYTQQQQEQAQSSMPASSAKGAKSAWHQLLIIIEHVLLRTQCHGPAHACVRWPQHWYYSRMSCTPTTRALGYSH
jgi:hypothetical protein